MMLRRIACVSTPVPDLASGSVSRIVTVSRANNARRGITGVLIYTGSDFAQLIEGPADAVDQLLRRLISDLRHQDLKIFLDETVEHAWFHNWRVGFLEDQVISRRIAEWRALDRRMTQSEIDGLRALLTTIDAF